MLSFDHFTPDQRKMIAEVRKDIAALPATASDISPDVADAMARDLEVIRSLPEVIA